MRKRAQGRIAGGQPKNSGLDARMNAPAWYRCALSKSGDAEGLFCCASHGMDTYFLRVNMRGPSSGLVSPLSDRALICNALASRI